MKQSCFFIGHRNTSAEMRSTLYQTIERLIIQEQIRNFYVGGYGSFDCMAGEAVCDLKIKNQIYLYLVIPYHPAVRPIETPPGYDGTYYPEGMELVHPRYAIMQANRRMIDSCDHLIACVHDHLGNSYKLLEYARKREKRGLLHIINIG